jgi:hypothetical protein
MGIKNVVVKSSFLKRIPAGVFNVKKNDLNVLYLT